jgi:hypothetical protein
VIDIDKDRDGLEIFQETDIERERQRDRERDTDTETEMCRDRLTKRRRKVDRKRD